ncbi:MAG: bifunctional phosphopantothenoylcysteine decarboxylase/phosphopantothenate--cysteine ligase CoaBC [Thermoplasmatales archaeon]|nr:bifunctional phosphopantothenoylcysteine decarboxylase/phosphopantothenate--cysteine ligase CoaBC [Candidatus Thermoplasmatota archaeon]MCL6002116.1 bifunctional phosphopantothenoylcysteine decarboxylase/phosphopantothenate--cysteine ligase CoaBC [Candidatus Thermoplasmatota archaeon]MDA8055283.1 bifunctional phosphopantothenoylcysteine decarboxylase/phosphopantothenate--cysteine ligase CoaBC [Thermoplasmatales archaeon]
MPKKKVEFNLKSSLLRDKKVILGVTGSISAVESVKLIHELRRHGAEVFPVVTESAKKIINPSSLEYASENKVVEELTGAIEHVRLVEDSDIFLVAPSTANTISKMAHGIDDSPVTSVFSNALEKIPVVVVPAMHLNMYTNPIIVKNIEILKSYGVLFLEPQIEEAKAKIADVQSITAEVIRVLHNELKGRKICVIGGSSYESIDDVRVITNNSTGETAVDIAMMAYYLGAEVKFLLGNVKVEVPSFLKFERFTNLASLVSKIDSIKKSDTVIVPAALSDFTTEKSKGKKPTDRPFTMTLKPAPKFLKLLREKYTGIIVGFKAEFGIPKKELLSRAKKRMLEYSLNMMVANDLRDVRQGITKVTVLSGEKETELEGDKIDVAKRILELLP